LENLKPRDVIVPVNPLYTAQEWEKIYAAQKPNSEYSPNSKQGTESELVKTFVMYLSKVYEKIQ
jgi:hypothetical protein